MRILILHGQREIKFPIPQECSVVDPDTGNCKNWKIIGKKEGDSPETKASYIINNASRIYPDETKMGQSRFNFYNSYIACIENFIRYAVIKWFY